jgi:hypothetical protein
LGIVGGILSPWTHQFLQLTMETTGMMKEANIEKRQDIQLEKMLMTMMMSDEITYDNMRNTISSTKIKKFGDKMNNRKHKIRRMMKANQTAVKVQSNQQEAESSHDDPVDSNELSTHVSR